MKLTRENNELIVRIPLKKPRFNPYMSDDEQKLLGEYDSVVGLIIKHNKDGNDWEEMGFASTIDRAYKGKDEDVGDFLVKYYGEEDSFIEECKKLGLGIVFMEV